MLQYDKKLHKTAKTVLELFYRSCFSCFSMLHVMFQAVLLQCRLIVL